MHKEKIQETLVEMDSQVPVPVTRYAVGIDIADINDLEVLLCCKKVKIRLIFIQCKCIV